MNFQISLVILLLHVLFEEERFKIYLQRHNKISSDRRTDLSCSKAKHSKNVLMAFGKLI